jgi:DNA-binding transcriptional regulator YbjK
MSLLQENLPIKRRSKGEQTRKQILNAAIDVLAQQGIKGATHRAIAFKANIQLSLTTYYFKDIQELVHQAFQLSSSQTLFRIENVWQIAFDLIESYDKTSLRKVAVKEELRDNLAELSTQYIHKKIVEHPIALAVEQLLFTEIQISPALRQLANSHRQALLQPFIQWCRYFNKNNPQVDADIMLTMFTQLEYRNLSVDKEFIDIDEIKATTTRTIGIAMNLK